MVEKITILHTNDMHSHFENWPKIRRYLLTQKEALTSANSSVLTFDIGDAMDRVHPLSEATDGQANVALLNEIHYDGVTIGNNEGLGNNKEQLSHLYDQANFDVILGNLLDKTNQQLPNFAEDFKIIKTKNNTRVAVLGLTAPFILTYPLEGWQPIDVFKAIPYLLKRIEGQYDVLVLLSHLGLSVDEQIATRFSDFDVIIGSHTHHLLEHGKRVKGTLLAAAGKYGQYIGKIDLELADHQVINSQARVAVTEHLPEEPTDHVEIESYRTRGEQLLKQQQIARIPVDLSVDFENSTKLINVGLKAIQEATGAEAALLNTGLFLTGINAGIVNRNQMHEMLPHAMHVMKVTLSGANLIRLIREVEKNRNFLRRFPLKGMGFRGKIFGEVHYDGIEFDPIQQQVFYRGEPVNIFEQYTIASLDHYLFIPFFPTIEIAGKNELMYNKFFRDVVSDYLTKHFPID